MNFKYKRRLCAKKLHGGQKAGKEREEQIKEWNGFNVQSILWFDAAAMTYILTKNNKSLRHRNDAIIQAEYQLMTILQTVEQRHREAVRGNCMTQIKLLV